MERHGLSTDERWRIIGRKTGRISARVSSVDWYKNKPKTKTQFTFKFVQSTLEGGVRISNNKRMCFV